MMRMAVAQGVSMPKPGDIILLPIDTVRYLTACPHWRERYNFWGEGTEEYTVVEHRYTTGIFLSDEAKEAGHITPLCELYVTTTASKTKYIANYGEYQTNLIPAWKLK